MISTSFARSGGWPKAPGKESYRFAAKCFLLRERSSTSGMAPPRQKTEITHFDLREMGPSIIDLFEWQRMLVDAPDLWSRLAIQVNERIVPQEVR
jgi:hypothetical protein